MKSLAMNKLFSKSREQDLPKINSELLDWLKTINKNVLYVTYKLDMLSKNQQSLDAREYYDEHGNSDNNPTE